MRTNRVILTNGSSRFTLDPNFTDSSVVMLDNNGTTRIDLEVKSLRLNNGLILNSATTGTPSVNATITVERGASTDAQFIWDETNDDWRAGLVGSTLAIVRRVQADIVNANLTAGVYTFTHNIGKYPQVTVMTNALDNIGMTPTHTSVNAFTLDFSQVLVAGALVGTWRIIAEG